MSDYTFDGLEQWEQEMAKLIAQEYPREFEQMVIQVAYELQGRVKVNSPKDTGRLQNSWKVGEIQKQGNDYIIEVYTNVDYAEHVEYGHRTRGGGGLVKGSHMMEISLAEVQQALPFYLKEWLDEFLSKHEFF